MSEIQILINHLQTFSYIGIFGVAILANVVVPVPEEVVLLIFGYLAGAGKINGFIVIPVIIAGSFVSDYGMFWLSKHGNKFLTGFYNKFFAKGLDTKREWLERHITKVIFFARFLVQLRFLGPFLAGQKQVKNKTFIKFDLLALCIYVPIYIFIGWYFRDRIEFIASGVGIVRNLFIIVAGIAILFSISKFARDFMFGKKKEKII